MSFPSTLWEEHLPNDLGQDEEDDEPAPHQKPEVDIVPESDKGEDDQVVDNGSQGSSPAAGNATAEWNEEVSYNPAIVTSMPSSPKFDR